MAVSSGKEQPLASQIGVRNPLSDFVESYRKSYPDGALLNAKGDLNRDFDRDGVAILRRRIELPVADRADGFVIQSDAERRNHLGISHGTTRIDDKQSEE